MASRILWENLTPPEFIRNLYEALNTHLSGLPATTIRNFHKRHTRNFIQRHFQKKSQRHGERRATLSANLSIATDIRHQLSAVIRLSTLMTLDSIYNSSRFASPIQYGRPLTHSLPQDSAIHIPCWATCPCTRSNLRITKTLETIIHVVVGGRADNEDIRHSAGDADLSET